MKIQSSNVRSICWMILFQLKYEMKFSKNKEINISKNKEIFPACKTEETDTGTCQTT